jgi:hypothetical protein
MLQSVPDVATFNARSFAGRLGGGGPRYHQLVALLNQYNLMSVPSDMAARGLTHASYLTVLESIMRTAGEILTAAKQPAASEK